MLLCDTQASRPQSKPKQNDPVDAGVLCSRGSEAIRVAIEVWLVEGKSISRELPGCYSSWILQDLVATYSLQSPDWSISTAVTVGQAAWFERSTQGSYADPVRDLSLRVAKCPNAHTKGWECCG